jgi:uncharacterized protein YoxC
MMDMSMYELVEKILWSVSFIAIGGALALIFFFIFATSILGSKIIQKQLDKLHRQIEQMNEHLKKIAHHLEDDKDGPKRHT